MFWDAFVWGLGVSCGGSIGLFGFVIALAAWRMVTGEGSRWALAAQRDIQAVEALRERNRLTVESNATLSEIAESLKLGEMGKGKYPS